MKKIFLILAMIMLTLTCGVILTACGGNNPPTNNRNGEKCYVTYDEDLMYMQFETVLPNEQSWIGLEDYIDDDNSTKQKVYFIKGDIVNIKAELQRPYEYFTAEDFEIVVDGQPITLTKQNGSIGDYGITESYYTGSFTIQKDVVVTPNNVHEKEVACTIKADSYESLYSEFSDRNSDLTPENIESLFYDLYLREDDNDIFVRFDDESIFGLPKAEWGLNELRNYINQQTGNKLEGNVKVHHGTKIYLFTKGYYKNISTFCIKDMEVEREGGFFSANVGAFPHGYANENENEYGFEYFIQPQMLSEDEGRYHYEPGEIKINPHKNPDFADIVGFGNLRKHFDNEDEYLPDENILNVPNSNSIYRLSADGINDDDMLQGVPMSYFKTHDKLQLQIKLNKYQDSTWKALYDKMSIKIHDKELVKGVDFTISSSGTINLTLDRPYKYYDSQEMYPDKNDPEISQMLSHYMFTYEFRCDIVLLAKKAGLLTSIPVSPNDATYRFGNDDKNELSFFGDNVGIYNDSFNNQFNLVVSSDDRIGDFWGTKGYTKVTIKDNKGNSYTGNIIVASEGIGIDEQIKSLTYGNASVVAIKDENIEGDFANYLIKFKGNIVPQEIHFHN